MKVIPRNILSALLSVVFVVVSITGILMYFKIRMFSIQTLHIWLGFAFALAGCLHLFKNWKGFLSYFKKRSTFLSIAFGIFVIIAFIVIPIINPQEKRVSPRNQLFKVMMSTPLFQVADFMDLDADRMVKALANEQIVASKKQSVVEIAQANEKSNDEIVNIVFKVQKVQ